MRGSKFGISCDRKSKDIQIADVRTRTLNLPRYKDRLKDFVTMVMNVNFCQKRGI
jgi:hypothetical protein